ncbi:MAG: glycosyl hydrolase family 18 protein [Sporolactobacillus sp.]
MNGLSLFADRVVRAVTLYLILTAGLIIGLPCLVIFYHTGTWNEKSPENILPETIQLSLNQTTVLNSGENDEKGELSVIHFGRNPLTFGWLSGSPDQTGTYNKLQVVSPLCAELSSTHAIKPVIQSESVAGWHQRGIKVWGRVALSSQTPYGARAYLANPVLVRQDITALSRLVQKDSLDGLNIDIENVGSSDLQAYLTYIRQLVAEVKKVRPQTIMSVDIQSESDWSPNQRRMMNQAFAASCDYIIFMGYDQHWSTDPTPGPVASLDWLKENVQQLQQDSLPSGKLLLGLPSYTRIWQTGSQGQTVSSRAVSNEYINNILAEEKIPQHWQAETGAYYSTFTYRGNPYKVWSQDTKAVQSLLMLVRDYHLAGFGYWSLNLMSPQQWNTLASTWRQ